MHFYHTGAFASADQAADAYAGAFTGTDQEADQDANTSADQEADAGPNQVPNSPDQGTNETADPDSAANKGADQIAKSLDAIAERAHTGAHAQIKRLPFSRKRHRCDRRRGYPRSCCHCLPSPT